MKKDLSELRTREPKEPKDEQGIKRFPESYKRKTNYRSIFEKDRDRILYSTVYRRMNDKTQVFLAGYDHVLRTRLTHTIEVEQIASTISRKLGLNTSLTSAIALGHDIGHTPFGHVGERYLNMIMNGCNMLKRYGITLKEDEKGYKHNWQSIRVARELENVTKEYSGLNLTNYTLWGILNHTNKTYQKCRFKYDGGRKCSLNNKLGECINDDWNKVRFYLKGNEDINDDRFWSIEAVVVRWADEIAQRHHDIDDGIISGTLDVNSLIRKLNELEAIVEDIQKDIEFSELFDGYNFHEKYCSRTHKMENLKKSINSQDKKFLYTQISKILIDCYTTFIIFFLYKFGKDILRLMQEYNISTNPEGLDKDSKLEILEAIRKEYSYSNYSNVILDYSEKWFGEKFKKFDKEIASFFMISVIRSYSNEVMNNKSEYILKHLVEAYLTNPQQLPDITIEKMINSFSTFFNDEIDEELRSVISEKVEMEKGEISFEQYVGHCREYLHCHYPNIDKIKYIFGNDDKKKEYYRKLKVIMLRTVCDYISGMGDSYALEQYKLLYTTMYPNNKIF